MNATAFAALVRKDLQLFFADRRSVIVSFVVPIVIASFFGSLFSGSRNAARPRVEMALVDEDGSGVSQAIVASARADESLTISSPTAADARDAVRHGTTTVAVVIPRGFGDAAAAAFFGGGEKPALEFVYDPSRTMELAVVRGIMTQHVMGAVGSAVFGGPEGKALVERSLPQVERSTLPEGEKRALVQLLKSVASYAEAGGGAQAASGGMRRGFSMPYVEHAQALTAASNVAYNGYAHSFAGMAIQFLLFAMANMGVEMLLERQRGLWRRLRSAPVSRFALLASKVASGAVISFLILAVSFTFAIAVFGVRVSGSLPGFVAVGAACAIMAATFGVLVAALGNTPATARGITTLAVLMMVMLGGAWVPTFVFPAWLQRATVVVPVRWAVDGLDAMTWRGLGIGAAIAPALALLGFAAVFGLVAWTRFRWEEA